MLWCLEAVNEFVFPLPLRSVSKDGGRHNSGKGANKEKLWVSSKEPLKQPLLKMLLNNQELSNLACNAFTDILYLLLV